MKNLMKQIVTLLIQVQNMDKDNAMRILSMIKTEEQAINLLNWLKTITLEKTLTSQVIDKVEELTKN